MEYVCYFFAGVFCCNCIPHLVSGLQGSAFPTPFAKPRGVGDSSPLVNFLWGLFSLVVALALLAYRPVAVGISAPFGLFVLGFIVLGVFTALHFGKVRSRSKR